MLVRECVNGEGLRFGDLMIGSKSGIKILDTHNVTNKQTNKQTTDPHSAVALPVVMNLRVLEW